MRAKPKMVRLRRAGKKLVGNLYSFPITPCNFIPMSLILINIENWVRFMRGPRRGLAQSKF